MADSSAPVKKKEAPKSFARRDFLRDVEKKMQAQWEEQKAFEVDAPADADVDAADKNKYFVTFPYPYMNGLLHLGHVFSLAKMDFSIGYERLHGKRTLFPFGFHATGMPIQAAANKLKRELEKRDQPEEEPEAAAAVDRPAETAEVDLSKHHSKKGKVGQKKSKAVSQAGILIEMGVPEEEIPKFQDPEHWLHYFPPLAKEHLKLFGVKVDWRRSFITTSVNPYYDSFIRWQFNKLRRLDKLSFGKRYSVYSPLDGQLCADHDRAVGEGVLPQEYTLIKMELVQPFPPKLVEKLAAVAGKKVSLVAATLRPETMYGQTNCWVLPDGEYGVFEIVGGEYVVCCERAAKNMSYQDLMPEFGKFPKYGTVTGHDLIGAPLKAPLCPFDVVYCLPMLTISLNKGTGIVTSVPSDAPDDYMALLDLKKKAPLREKFGVSDEMVMPFEPVPIIDIPGMGDMPAKLICEELKIQSQNDRDKLAIAKEKVYTKGFYEGVMTVGEHKGAKVATAKPLVRQKLIDSGDALAYAEPEKYVESRTGDECVVALTDQWYVKYGETEWRQSVEKHLATMELFTDDTRKLFEGTLGWLKEWGCSRSFGLGTKLPWDEQFVIESLSDSTVYMAYYTVAQFLQGDIAGTVPGSAGITADQLTDEVWEYILGDSSLPATPIPEATLAKLRHEFRFWYPVDLRASGKDLIQNHLTFFLYNHVALFPEKQWPRAIRTNGHVMLNSEKMSKSTGNFLTLLDAIEKFGVDATRLALSQAGDSNEDANFDEENANASIMRLHNEAEWFTKIVEAKAKGELRSGPLSAADKMFDAEISKFILDADSGYARQNFRDAINAAFYNLQLARDFYRAEMVSQSNLHVDVIFRFMEVQALLLSPICPHICEHLWKLIGKEGSILNARFPTPPPIDKLLLRTSAYIQWFAHEARRRKLDTEKARKGKKGATEDGELNTLDVVIANEFIDFQQQVIKISGANVSATGFAPDLKQKLLADPIIKANSKLALPFASFVETDYAARGAEAFELTVPFDEPTLLAEIFPLLRADLALTNVRIHLKSDPAVASLGQKAAGASPGKPACIFSHVPPAASS